MSEEPSILQLVQELNNWFCQLNETEREEVLTYISEGYGEILEWLEENHPSLEDAMDQFQDYVHELLRDRPEEVILAQLQEQGVTDIAFAEATLETAKRYLLFYFDAEVLRRLEIDEFDRIVELVIKDIFVKRKNRSIDRRAAYLNVEDRQIVEKYYKVIFNLVLNFYDRYKTFEDLEMFMIEELRFSGDQIEVFSNQLSEHLEAIDRMVLFRRLSQLRNAVDDVAEAIDEM